VVSPAASEQEGRPLALAPATVAEASDALRRVALERRVVSFAGGGTEPWPLPPAATEAVLSTTRLDRLREHAPADQIVVVEAGMTLATLQRHLAPHGQRVALDPPRPERATLGGIVAAGAFGPGRTRHGAIRDLVIGATLIRADGVVARGGGKVVKNVAGFDLPRLLCGSLGTLGLVAEVVLRLHPLPEASETVTLQGLDAGLDAAAAWALVRALREAQLEPAAVAALPQGERFQLAVRFEGFGPGVRAQADRCLALGARAGLAAATCVGAAEAVLWARHDALRTAGDVRARATFLPARAAAAVEALHPLAAALQDGAVLLYPTIGIAFVTGTAGEVGPAAAALEVARRAVAPGNGAVVLAAAPVALLARAGVYGSRPPGALPLLELSRRLQAAFDPEGRLSPGRLPGGTP
jgi:glycolate oxidase FAD binding subunit